MKSDTAPDIYAVIHMPCTDEGTVDRQLLNSVQHLARNGGGDALAIVVGACLPAMAEAVQQYGFKTVWHIVPKDGGKFQPHQAVDAIASACGPGGAIALAPNALLLTSAEAAGMELAGRLAARLNATPLGKCLDIQLHGGQPMQVRRAAFGGRLTLSVQGGPGRYIAAVRELPGSGGLPDMAAQATEVRTIKLEPAGASIAVTQLPRTEEHPALDGASIVVTGGRGIGAQEGFDALYELAGLLGGAVGASLPAIDAGWAPVARQVGQSGKYVSPATYVAVGVSGTAQHLAGVAPHSRIVAINKDPEAAIFQVADVGVVADWREFLPALIGALQPAQPAAS